MLELALVSALVAGAFIALVVRFARRLRTEDGIAAPQCEGGCADCACGIKRSGVATDDLNCFMKTS